MAQYVLCLPRLRIIGAEIDTGITEVIASPQAYIEKLPDAGELIVLIKSILNSSDTSPG